MVFESVVVDVLNRFLGDYVVNLDSSQLKLGIWGGAVALKNLEIKENALSQLDVPFKVKAGHIGKLDLKIPWKNLYTQPVEAVLDGVYLLIVPIASIKYDAEKEEKQFLEARQRELLRIEEAKQKVADQEKPKEEKQDTFVEKLVTQVIKNLQVKISNIHIRYEDDVTNSECPLSFGVSLQNLSLQTSDKNWNPCLHDESSKLFYKIVRLDNLFAYWNVKSEMYYHRSYNEALGILKYGVASQNVMPEGYDFVFRPISGRAKLRMNPRSDFDFSSPKIDLDVNLQDIAIEFKKPQYHSVMELLESIDMMSRNLPYRKFRPNVGVHNNAKKWWNYAITGILEVNVKPRVQMWSWKHIRKHRQQTKRYKDLYRTKITSKKPSEDIIRMTEECEGALDIFCITLARQQAEVEANKAGLKIFRPGIKDEDSNSKGWFGWMWGWSGEDQEKKEVAKSGSIGELMSTEEKSKLYAAIGYSETAVDPTLPKTYESMIVCVKLLSMSIQLREDRGKSELINFTITDLSTVLKQRPGAQAIRFEAQIGTFEITGIPLGNVIPCLLSSRNVVVDNNISLLSLMFETNPLDESADQRLIVDSQPLEIIYDAKTINSLVDFFRPPKEVHLEQLTSATLNKLEEFRDKTSTGLLYVIETQKVLDLKIDLMASYIIVPQNGFYDLNSNLLILDLGSLKMTSKSRCNLPQLKIGQNSLEDIMSRAYESFDVQLSSMQLLYSRHYENWKEARSQKHSALHILEPMDLRVDFSRAMVVTDARMPKIKLFGELPILSVKISDQKLKGVLELIDSIPKPESSTAPSASPKKAPSLKSPPMTTPLLVAKHPDLVALQSIIESDLESESDEFYDAPTSPVEDMPFFDVSNGSLTKVNITRRKKLAKQETLKNLTEFQMRFEIPVVVLQLCSLSEDTETTVLQMEILGLGTELNVRTFDMSANAFLREISLKCPQYTDDEGKPVYLITTLDNTTDDLLIMEYIKADVNGPEFKTTYKNIEQLIQVNFSSLDVHLHTEALLNSMSFVTNLMPQSEKKEPEQPVQEVVEEEDEEEKREGPRKKLTLKKSKYDDVISLHVRAQLACLRVFIQERECKISEISIEGLDSEVVMKKTSMDVLAKLKNIVILDSDCDARYKKAVYITGKEVFSFKMVSYVGATEGASYSDMNIVDSAITLTVGCIQVIFVNKFVSALLAFINNFQAAKEALTEATVHAAEIAASGVKELAQHSFRLALDINIKAPVVIVPQSSTSTNVLVADLGLINIKNHFSIVAPKIRSSLPPVIDCMMVKLSDLKLYRTLFENGSLVSELELLQPLNLDITIERNLAAAWYSDIPDIKIIGNLKPMNLILGQEDLTIILRTLNENLGDTSDKSDPEKNKTENSSSGGNSLSHVASGTTVVTAAVVETYTPMKVKTTLKLDFQFDSLTLNLYSSSPSSPLTNISERDISLKLAEFKLGLISTAVKMSSDGSMSAAVKLTNCMLDDKRQAIQKATPRMMEMKRGTEKNVMVDVCYKQGREGTLIDVTVRDIYMCTSVEFLCTVADIFIKANEQSSAALRSSKQTSTPSKEAALKPQVSRMEMNVVVKNPEFVFVADLSRADAPALVLTTQCELSIKNCPEQQHMTAAVKNLHVKACPFLPDKRDGKITTILQPCDVFFQSVQSNGGPQNIELSIKSLMLKVSPVIINTVITITSALSTSRKESISEATSPVPADLWKKKDLKDLKFWFLEEENEKENKNSGIDQIVLTGEKLDLSIDSIIITLEAGVGHRTLPILLAKSSFKGNVKNWTTLINLYCQLELEVHYYNEIFGVWEPLLEPLEVERSDNFRPWSLEVKMKKKLRKQICEIDGEEENYKIPDYVTALNIFSKDQLNITLSKCGILTLTNLGQAFAEAASKTSDIFKKDQAPFVITNLLGLHISVFFPSDSFTALNVDPSLKSIELDDGESLSMDYVRTKAQTDQFSAMTSLSSKHFYMQLTPWNHSSSDKIPLTKVGRSLYCVRHSDSGVERYIVCQIDSVEGTKCITIRSPLQIRNHFMVAFEVYHEDTCLGTAEPESDFNIPLSTYRSTLCFKPALEEYEKCEGIDFEEFLKNQGSLLGRKCHSRKNNADSFIVNIVPVMDTLISSACTDERWDLPYVVHMWPSVVLHNLLPYQVAYSREGADNDRVEIEDGCSVQIHNAVVDETKLRLRLSNYLDLNWEVKYHIQSKQPDIHFITFLCISELEKAELDIAVHVTYTTGQTILAIHSPYWMVNKTGRMLQYKADDVHRKHPADHKKPLLFSFKPKNFFQNNKVQLMITDSELSDPFSLDTVGSHGSVKCKSKQLEYQVGVSIHASSFNLTRIVTFTPFFMIANRSIYKVHIIEEGSERVVIVCSGQCVPFWPENSSHKLSVQVEGCQIPPKNIHFNKQDSCTLLHLGDKLGGILVDVTPKDYSTVITFSDYLAGSAPFLLINDTKSENIEFCQSSVNGENDALPPGKAALFAWEDPTSERALYWKCGTSAGTVTQIEDRVEYLRMESSIVYLVSFLEGLQRIVLFTEDEKVFQVTYDSEKAELADQEVTVSLSNIGISLVNNYSKQEVSYIGITSSDVVWETKKKTRWRPLSVKQTDTLEAAYKDYSESSPTDNRIVELEANSQVCLTPTLTGMKFLQPPLGPVRRSFLPALKVEYSASAHQASIRLQVYRIQIQNQIPGAIFPFVFYPVKPPKSVTMDSEPKPFTDVSIVMRTAGHSEISRIKYFKVLIQEMDLRVDLGFLYALADLFTQSGKMPKDQVEELFKKDIESIQAELSTVSSISTSRLSLYEDFHISPIKLHLSFSLSTGGDDGNKELRDKELIPVQSLNLLLKSIGATLTDVQDVVFKLAFFEIRNQVYSTQELQWEVIRHYSRQAIKQMYVLVLGLDVLGNPFGLFRDLSEGVEAFFYEPYQGAIQGPEEFVEGMALGVKALVGGAVGGLAGAASRITSAMAKGVAAITMDEEYQQKRREAMNKQPSGIREGLARGGKGLVSGFVSGITGIVTKPIKGAQKEGAAGFFKGIGKGLVGAVTRPTGGIIDMASSTFQGIKRATDSSDEVESLRPPRFIHEDGVIRPYKLREGTGSQMLQKIENGRFAKCKYFAHAMVNNTDLLMVMKSGVLFVTKGTFGQLTCEWQYSFDEFTKEPIIVNGRRLRIEAKERVKSVFHAKEFGKIINFKTPDDAKWILSKLEEVRDLHRKDT
ncbi:LOW QUALITY PROTEIN: vacuolar protein sorting-associated protein 13A [Bufo bufo]|uniref:LOW QUALITY PROTEIN: vacuolar protein sorting-associated protein 13A n=1 Tax=Bufo bufo TaxID=8384 RepID=UPI001ABDA981|nr:LOW QUALITY PROTEIN: vacuolar protein sorting-associated protein 13A [Bufo bufo]